jgi:hypothetical protein
MKSSLHPILLRVFSLAKWESTPPAADLEERILADWRGSRRTARPGGEPLRELRLALAGAVAVLLITCAVSAHSWGRSGDYSVILANIAVRSGLTYGN